MNNYIELAHKTSAPIEKPIERLAGNAATLSYLRDLLRRSFDIGADFDEIKRHVFYGRSVASFTPAAYLLEPMIEERLTPQTVELLHAGIGMLTEAVEFLQALKDHIYNADKLDETLLKEEIGDSFWYLAKACKFLGTTFEEEQARNIAKLKARYPDKFTEDKAANRDLEKERSILEQPVCEPSDLHKRLIGQFDARVWAREFVEIIRKNPSIPSDEGCMISWFANAIMAGYDHAQREQREANKLEGEGFREGLSPSLLRVEDPKNVSS